jgi:hypothetical protein
MRSLPLLILAVVSLALASANKPCPNASTQNCVLGSLNGQDVILRNQAFCPLPDTASGLERQGLGCAALQSCCSVYTRFDQQDAFRMFGPSKRQTSSQLVVPAGGYVRLEFTRETCASDLSLSLNGVASVRGQAAIIGHHERGYGQDTVITVSDFSNPVQLNSLCHLMALTIKAPKDAALTVQSVGLCLLDATLDVCGVCNGNGQSCQADRDAAVVARRDPSVRRLLSAGDNERRTVGPAPTSGPVPSGWVDAACLSADKGVIPTVFCHTQINDNQCLTVFGYNNPNPYPVFLPAGTGNNYFIRDPLNQGQNCFFLPGVEEQSFAIEWNCTRHDNFYLQWVLNTPTVNNGNGDTQIAKIHREHERSTCTL